VPPRTHEFLSDSWIAEARKIRDRHAEAASNAIPEGVSVRMNLVITEVPFGEGVIDAHIDSSTGSLTLDLGHVENPEVTLTVDYATSRALFVDQDVQAAMSAFMSGKIRVEGDISKLMALGSLTQGAATPDDVDMVLSIADELKAITAE
jgi:putative sterol carrier protein